MPRRHRVSRRVVRFVARREGFVPHAYKAHPSEAHLTIGYGHYGPDVRPGQRITKRDARKLLRRDLHVYAEAVDTYITRKLRPRQRDALISWTYNVGVGALIHSNLRKRLNAGENRCRVIREELRRWVYAGGKQLPGLVNRRNAEIRLARCRRR